MPNLSRNFVAGRMNKSLDERLIPNGEYIDAINIRMGSTELSEIGVIENTKGNEQLTTLEFLGAPLSNDAVCIGAFEDGARETIYWFVHDPNNPLAVTLNKVDLIVSFNINTSVIRYHIVSEYELGTNQTTLNFNPKYLVHAVNMVDDLLFFTDNYNPPRYININKTYLQPSLGVDQFPAEEILVIKRPPAESPVVTPLVSVSNDNFMQDRFICFAYRYRYDDNQYSATSQFSQPAFIPGNFSFTPDSFLNGGMQNLATNATIQVNTGSSLVKGIDILFKEASSNIIKVIVKLDKANLGIANNTTYTYTFGDSKIFTILPDFELLRLYDNVPRYSKAQTIMGNRLIYGNYIEGYDMEDLNGLPVNLEYVVELVSDDIENITIPRTLTNAPYTIDVPVTVANAGAFIDLTTQVQNLKEGSLIIMDFSIEHAQFTNGSIPETTQNINLSFSYTLPQDFSSVSAMVNSSSFANAIGTIVNIQTLSNCALGSTFTDQFNCAIPQSLDNYSKVLSGVTGPNQPIYTAVLPLAPNSIYIFFPAVEFFNSTTSDTVYEYYKITNLEVTFRSISNVKSLHSNRGYEVGIVYMDEFGRSSTPFVSSRNTVFVPCGNSSLKNSIRVTIPTGQIAPYWAKRYKFFIKQDLEGYETIYSNIFFGDPNNNSVWFLLDGENAQKVEEGDRLTVKSDTLGVISNCVYATVLEKKVQPINFITVPGISFIPSGLYVRILPSNFNTVKDPDSYVDLGFKQVSIGNVLYPVMQYPVTMPGTLNPIDIPSGSRIRFYVELLRKGPGGGDGKCERRRYILDKEIISSNSYPSFYSFFVGEDVQSILNDGVQDIGDGSCNINNYFNPSIRFGPPVPQDYCPGVGCTGVNVSECVAEYRFQQDTSIFPEILMVSGGVWACGNTDRRKASISMHIEIFRATDLIIFETQPSDTLPDIFYESSQSFSIDSLGQHSGNVQSQNFALNAPAIIDTDFYNCYAFGNGAESYKILDSASGKQFNLGNRVTATSSKDYMEVHRYFDLTYSGTYNDESNVNRLNEFNLGLLNFKPLENSFGSIEVLFGRETDVLVLQEDKISYVLAGKNLLSDSAAGGAVTSVPEVLGTQIARIENYGISKNPESFVSYGYDKYFTDSKRGSVLKLSGSSYSNDELTVVSESGMRTWFRDLFINDFDTQKLGGYDPYMNEYVLSANNKKIALDDQCYDCNTTINLQVNAPNPGVLTLASELCFEYGRRTGDVSIDIIYSSPSNPIEIESIYNNITYSTGQILANTTLTFPKDIVSISQGYINIYVEQDSNITLQVSCPGSKAMKVVQICITNNSRAGQFIHNEYNYNSGLYTSPIMSTPVQISSGTLTPMVSYYNQISGFQGDSFIPVDGSTVTLRSNKIGFDTFQFDPTGDRFMWLRTSAQYLNNPVDISALLGSAFTATPIISTGAPDLYYSQFTLPAIPPVNDYLYLIWNYGAGVRQSLCYSNNNPQDSCCNCFCNEPCESFKIEAIVGAVPYTYIKCPSGPVVSDTLSAGDTITICASIGTFSVGAPALITKLICGCTNDLPKPSGFAILGNYYTGYTEPYQQFVSYTSNPVQASICQANAPMTGTIYSLDVYYTTDPSIVIGTQLYTDNIGTLSTFSGILIFTPTPDVLPNDIANAVVIYVMNGVVSGISLASNYISNC